MSRSAQIALGVFGVSAIACAAFALFGLVSVNRFVEQAASFTPEEAAARADTIAAIEPPPGYAPLLAVELNGMTTVTFAPTERAAEESSRLVYTLLQAPGRSEGAEQALAMLAEEMQGMANGRGAELAPLGERELEAAGGPATLRILEGQTQSGVPVRQAQLRFEGRGGPALLVVSSDLERWDQAQVDAVIASLDASPAAGGD